MRHISNQAGSNQHPADQLAEVRHQIAELKNAEKVLREQLLSMPAEERSGATYKANILHKVRSIINTDRMREEMGDINRFYDIKPFIMAQLEKLK
jgi:hypothetical protein